MRKLLKKFHMDTHHKMEWFGLSFLTLCAALIVTVLFAWRTEIKSRHIQLTDDAVLTKEFTMSRTGIHGEVSGVYTSKDKTKSLLMLYFSDMGKLSTDAKNWYMYYSSPNEVRKNDPAGLIYVFGDTGYVGLYFTDGAGFKPQASEIRLLHKKELTSDIPTPSAKTSALMKNNDVGIILANLGARKATHLSLLDGDKAMDVKALFAGPIYEEKYKALQADARKKLQDMKISLERIKELKGRLTRADVLVPDDPQYVEGDAITKDKGEFYANFKASLPGGFDFAWQRRKLSEGYLSLVSKQGENLRACMMRMKNEQKDTQSGPKYTDEWVYMDGTPVFDLDSSKVLSDSETSVQKDIQSLQSEWSNYYGMKREYQYTELPKFLAMDDSVQARAADFTLHSGKNVMTVWDQVRRHT